MSINIEQIKNYIADLTSADEEIQFRAEDALIEAGELAVDALIEAANDPDPQVRYKTIWILGKIGDPRVYSIILTHTNDPDSAVKYDSIIALGELGDVRAVEPLIEFMRAGVSAAAMSLVKIGKPAVDSLTKLLQTGSNDAKGLAAHVLGSIGDKSSIGHLAKLLVDYDEMLRIAAIEALAQMGEEHPLVVGIECLELIEERLTDPSTEVSDIAIYWSNVLRLILGMPTSEDDE